MADGEVDPLDAFMADINQTIATQIVSAPSAAGPAPRAVLRLDEESDELAAYAVEKQRDADAAASVERADADQLAAGAPAASTGLLLPPVDHAGAGYPTFNRAFYVPCPAVVGLSAEAVAALRTRLEVEVSGGGKQGVPHPVRTFEEAGLDAPMLAAIEKRGVRGLTPVQAQALPGLMSGRDAVVLAKTGSGKTLGFVWPMLVHIMDQREHASELHKL